MPRKDKKKGGKKGAEGGGAHGGVPEVKAAFCAALTRALNDEDGGSDGYDLDGAGGVECVVELVLGQWDAMRGATNRTVCNSAVSCVLRVTGPSAYSSLVTTAARGLNCTNNWLPRARDCRQSESMRRIRVLVDLKGQVLTHWTCKRIISQRKCDIEHYTRQPRNASGNLGQSRMISPPSARRPSPRAPSRQQRPKACPRAGRSDRRPPKELSLARCKYTPRAQHTLTLRPPGIE